MLRRPLHESLGRSCGFVACREPGPIVHLRLRRGWRLVLNLQLAQCDIIEQLSNRSGVRGERWRRQLRRLWEQQLELLPAGLREHLLLPLLQQRCVV